jgi:hypothetical protein
MTELISNMTSIQEEFSIDLGDEGYDCWATERNTILALAEEVKAATSLAEGLVAIEKSLRYFLTVELYLRANSDCYKSIVAMVAKLLGNPKASPIMPIILETKKFLANIRFSTFAELSAQFEEVSEDEEEAPEAPDSSQTGWPRSDRSIATLAAQAAAAGNAAEAETLRCVALLFADMRKEREEAEAKAAAEAEAKAAAEAKAKAAAEAEITAEAKACCSGCVQQREGELLAAEEAQRQVAALELALKEKVWGTLPYITDEDFTRWDRHGELPIEATQKAFGDMEFFIWTRGIDTYKLSRRSAAEKGCFVEEISGGANPCFLRPFPIDLHSKEGLSAFAAGKPLPHPMYLRDRQLDAEEKAKRSWFQRLFLCGTVAVETH